MKSNGLPRRMILKSRQKIFWIIRNGSAKQGNFLAVHQVKQEVLSWSRFAFMVSKNIRGAVERNRLKRIVRELVRVSKERFLNSDTIIVIQDQAAKKTFWQIKEDFVSLISGECKA